MSKNLRKFSISPGVLLILVTVVSLLSANSFVGESYIHFWHTPLPLTIAGLQLDLTLHHWINDGLMAVFFLLVGLEIKREISEGELSTAKRAMLPVSAAIGGMVVPALLFAFFNASKETSHGWGIPMATDIAFALAVLSMMKNSIPGSVRIFLTALAIIDDLGAVLVIAFFYTSGLNTMALLSAGGIALILVMLNRFKVQLKSPYLIAGILLWYFVLKSGVHATIAGVLLAVFIPVHQHNHRSMLHDIEHALTPFINYFVLPVFALANTALLIDATLLSKLNSPLAIGIMTGLIIGKPIGITLFSYLSVKLKAAELPRRVNFSHIAGAGILGGIGFTMSIFISMLAFDDALHQNLAKVAVLIASAVAGISGYVWLKPGDSEEKN